MSGLKNQNLFKVIVFVRQFIQDEKNAYNARLRKEEIDRKQRKNSGCHR